VGSNFAYWLANTKPLPCKKGYSTDEDTVAIIIIEAAEA
jgi:hypothetical protein